MLSRARKVFCALINAELVVKNSWKFEFQTASLELRVAHLARPDFSPSKNYANENSNHCHLITSCLLLPHFWDSSHYDALKTILCLNYIENAFLLRHSRRLIFRRSIVVVCRLKIDFSYYIIRRRKSFFMTAWKFDGKLASNSINIC